MVHLDSKTDLQWRFFVVEQLDSPMAANFSSLPRTIMLEINKCRLEERKDKEAPFSKVSKEGYKLGFVFINLMSVLISLATVIKRSTFCRYVSISFAAL